MKWGIWLSLLVMSGALVLVGFQQSRINQLRQRIVELEAQPAPAVEGSPPGSSRRLPGKSHDSRIARVQPKSGDRRGAEAQATEPDEDAQLGQSLRKMVDNPAGRAMMNQGIKAMTSMWFADLIGDFELTREESDYFLQLVAGPMSAQQQIGMKMMSAKTPEERNRLVEDMETAKNEARESIKEFLNNDEDWAAYENFEERLPERQQLDGLRAVMASAEAPLTPEQEDQVIEAMYRARTSAGSSADWQGAGGIEAIASGNAVERFESDWTRSSQRAAEEVGQVLDDTQLEAFRTYQEQMKDMQLMGIKMAEKMFSDENDDGGEQGRVPE